MKKIRIDPGYLDTALPPMSDGFERSTRAFLRALPQRQEEEIPVKRKSMTVLGLAIILVVILACGALASQLGLLEFIHTYDKESGVDVSGMIMKNPAPTGEALSLANIEIEEAFYDGQNIHFLAKADPTEADTALISIYPSYQPSGYDLESFEVSEYTLDEAAGYGDRHIGIVLDARVPGGMPENWPFGIAGGGARNGAGVSYIFNHILPEGVCMDEAPLSLRCLLVDLDTREVLEETTLAFTIPRTADPHQADFAIDRDLESIHMQSVFVSYTPLELNIAMVYRALWQGSYPEFGLLDDEGRVQGRGSNTMDFNRETGYDIHRIIFAAPGEMPTELALWVYYTDEVLLLNTETGQATLHPATVDYTGEPPALDDGLGYVGSEVMIVTYDKEVAK